MTRVIIIIASFCNLTLIFNCTRIFEPEGEIGDLSQEELLEIAYQEKSVAKLDLFFERWHLETVQITVSELNSMKPVEKEIYKIHRTIFRPNDENMFGSTNGPSISIKGKKIIIVQHRFRYIIDDSLRSMMYHGYHCDFHPENCSIEEIKNFRPKVDIPNYSVVYHSEKYEEILDNFLGWEFSDFGEGSIMNPSHPRGESTKRHHFLELVVRVLPGHWGGYWHFETQPLIQYITINSEMTRALVDYRAGWGGRGIEVYREGEEWIIGKTRYGWIE